jgi:hypothetical protein
VAITSLASYRSAAKQNIFVHKTAARLLQYFSSAYYFLSNSLWDGTGVPSAGSFAVGNTANGLVPDNTTAGAFPINSFSGTGYLTGATYVDFNTISNSIDGYYRLYDRLFHAGSYSFNANTSLTSQPSFSARVPNTDYSGLQIWIEAATAFTGNPAITVTYTDQSGNAGHSTGSNAIAVAPPIGAMWQMPLAAGDCGVRKIESVVCATATGGTFNVLILRPLLILPLDQYWDKNNVMEMNQWLDKRMPIVYPTSCMFLTWVGTANATASFDGVIELSAA